MLSIKYITNVRVPTPRAFGYAIMKMCEQFAENGAKVELVIPNRQNSDITEDPFEYYKIKKNFSISKIKGTDLLGPTLNFGKLFYWIDFLSFLFNLRSTVKFNNDDVIYTRDFLVTLPFSRNKFICLELHEIPRFKLFFNYAIKKPKLFFVLTKYLKEDLIKLGVKEDKIHVIPSGVELNDFNIALTKEEARAEVSLSKDKKIVMYTGHLYSWKGVDTLADCAKEMKDVLFVFVGGLDTELENFKNQYSKYENVMIVPFQKRDVIPLYLKSADILVLPNSKNETISTSYTSPLKLFEYMASKKPIISSDLPSLREVLNEENCLFAEADSTESFVESIEKIINNPELGEKLSEKAFQDVQKYSWDKRAQNILKYIDK